MSSPADPDPDDPEVPLGCTTHAPEAARALSFRAGNVLVGRTAHVTIFAAASLGAPAVATAKALLRGNLIEVFYKRVKDLWRSSYAPQITLTIGTFGIGAGTHSFGGTDIQYSTVSFRPDNALKWNYVASIFVAELHEIYSEHYTPSLHWSDVCDMGEAMSRVIAESFVSGNPKIPFSGSPNFSTTYGWWNAGRPDFVSRSTANYINGIGDYHVPVGANVCGIHYLHTVCKFSLPEIIAAGDTSAAPRLENVFHKLTGRTGLHNEMKACLDKKYPGVTHMPSGILTDNLFDRFAE